MHHKYLYLILAGNINLAPILMESCEPKIDTNGRLYQDSVIGALLSLSVLPRTASSLHEFFDNPMDQVPGNINLISITAMDYKKLMVHIVN